MGIGAEGDGDQLLTFILAGEEYGVDILRVQEIKGWDTATPIPNTPEHLRGVINLRGTIVPIIDLRLRFALESVPYGPTTVVIVLKVVGENTSRIMGIVVDGVSDVYNVSEDAMKPPPDFGSVIAIDFVKGLATVGDNMVIVLDIDHLLNSGDLVQADSVVGTN
ncbi:MAG: chemotaxis protein CheW [Gammaproteobacteria bacterium]|nr:chemotaxis protein CheW [Gammaproteobacteria bacterium]